VILRRHAPQPTLAWAAIASGMKIANVDGAEHDRTEHVLGLQVRWGLCVVLTFRVPFSATVPCQVPCRLAKNGSRMGAMRGAMPKLTV
jgi:hypothetical protein